MQDVRRSAEEMARDAESHVESATTQVSREYWQRMAAHWWAKTEEEEKDMHLTQTSEELTEALTGLMHNHFGTEIFCGPINTGGGTMVMAIDLSQDGRGMGRQIWLTREDERVWLLGFYDYANCSNDEGNDEGVVVELRGYNTPDGLSSDKPYWVAAQVVGILDRLGVTKLQGG